MRNNTRLKKNGGTFGFYIFEKLIVKNCQFLENKPSLEGALTLKYGGFINITNIVVSGNSN